MNVVYNYGIVYKLKNIMRFYENAGNLVRKSIFGLQAIKTRGQTLIQSY